MQNGLLLKQNKGFNSKEFLSLDGSLLFTQRVALLLLTFTGPDLRVGSLAHFNSEGGRYGAF